MCVLISVSVCESGVYAWPFTMLVLQCNVFMCSIAEQIREKPGIVLPFSNRDQGLVTEQEPTDVSMRGVSACDIFV